MSKRYKLNRGGAWYSLVTEYELNEHELEIASKLFYGHVMIGDNIDVDSGGVISVKEASTSSKGVVQIVDDLITDDNTKVLSARQGKELKDYIDIVGSDKVIVSDSLTNQSTIEALSANKGRELKVLVDELELNKATKSEFNTLEQYVHDNIVLNGVPVTQSEKDEWNSKSTFDGDYNNLTNKPNIPTLVDNLTSVSTLSGLTANQGRVLDGKIKTESDRVDALQVRVTDIENGLFIVEDTFTSNSIVNALSANKGRELYDNYLALDGKVQDLEKWTVFEF